MEDNDLEKKLGVWGIDRVTRDDGKIHAGDYYCVRCYGDDKEVAGEVFWPNVDIDIKKAPYCKSCVDIENMKLILGID